MNYQQHQWIGDNFDTKLANIFFSRTINGKIQHISFGEVTAISGDHIDVVRNSTPGSNVSVSSLQQPIVRMFTEVALPIRKKTNFKGSILEMKKRELDVDRWSKKTADEASSIWTRRYGDYISLARRNWHHFLPLCQMAWLSLHRTALYMASSIPKRDRLSWIPSGSPYVYPLDPKSDRSMHTFALALFLEACGCHYLMDCFPGGHLRTARIFYGTSLDAINNAKGVAHDRDNEDQIIARNMVGRFSSFGEDEEEDLFPTGPKIKPRSRLNHPNSAVKNAVQALFEIEDRSYYENSQNLVDRAISKLALQTLKYVPKQSIYWIPVDHPLAEEKGYKFEDKDDVNPKSCIMHIETLHRKPRKLRSGEDYPGESPAPQIIVADLTARSNFANLSNFYFFDREDGEYEKQTMFPSVHIYVSQGDPVFLQRGYFPIHGMDVFKKFNNYVTYDEGTKEYSWREDNEIFMGNYAPSNSRWK